MIKKLAKVTPDDYNARSKDGCLTVLRRTYSTVEQLREQLAHHLNDRLRSHSSQHIHVGMVSDEQMAAMMDQDDEGGNDHAV